ncbi:MAG TPA: nuclear transport factor 2 family protein [Candidatus Angelobacter sp.]|nr:nuclear transport factor 2 family protein [Candidatus Angelobacter sp.]
MTATENKQLIQSVFSQLAQGNSAPFVESMADDLRWTVMGQTKWSRTFAGKQAVLKELLAPLRAQIADRIRTVPQSFIAEGDHVVVEARGNNTTKAGLPYNNAYCFVIRVREGKVCEIREYMDTELVSSVLSEPSA